jgi:hypothetical protein
MVVSAGRDGHDLEVWRLTAHGADVPGRWVIVDRRFEPAEHSGGPID